jgi:Resolvase, N terminal domain
MTNAPKQWVEGGCYHDPKLCRHVCCCRSPLQNRLVIYGYARVSTTDQDHSAQVEHLMAAGALKVFSDKASGKDAERVQLKKAIAALDAGDVLMVTRIDRLARSTRDLLNIVHEVKQVRTFSTYCLHSRAIRKPMNRLWAGGFLNFSLAVPSMGCSKLRDLNASTPDELRSRESST